MKAPVAQTVYGNIDDAARTLLLASIAQLEADIERILRSQATMHAVNRAMRAGADDVLEALHFSQDHIAELRVRVTNGAAAFPDYAFRNNYNLIRRLRANLVEMQARLALDPACSNAGATPKSGRYRCETDRASGIPFLAAYLPFVL
jgi:hypothetical protein